MITDGKVIIEAPDGKRYVVAGSKAFVDFTETKAKIPYLCVRGTDYCMTIKLREIKRDKGGRKFKEGGVK